MSKKKAFIFDLDGTIFDDSKRQTIIEDAYNENGKASDEQWNNYHSACVDDPIFGSMDLIVKSLSFEAKIIILTGRDDFYANKTVGILNKHKIPYDRLFMRPAGNYRSSVDLKKEIYNKYIKPYYDVIGVFEDRDKVVKMWRDLGLFCLQTQIANY